MAVKPGIKYIGYWGAPPHDVIRYYQQRCALEFLDLDLDLGAPQAGILPDVYCQIIHNIINNALYYRDSLELIIASVGEEKCDQGRFAALVLKDMGFRIIETRISTDASQFEVQDNTNSQYRTSKLEPRISGSEHREITISTSNLPLGEKVDRIMETVIRPNEKKYEQCEPTCGFWGVPPHDMAILDLFPPTAHVYGWTRCVEAGRPADLELEIDVPSDIPIVFYAQSFCAKNQLAKYLAEKHRGIYIDCHGRANRSVLAKIEAFLRLG